MNTAQEKATTSELNTGKFLQKEYGPYLSIEQLATVLKRTPEGLRFTLRGSSEFAKSLQQARKKFGRRVLFETSVVAAVLESE